MNFASAGRYRTAVDHWAAGEASYWWSGPVRPTSFVAVAIGKRKSVTHHRDGGGGCTLKTCPTGHAVMVAVGGVR